MTNNKNNQTNNWNNDERDAYILSVENLSKVFDSPAGGIVVLNNINFRIKKGEFVSIVGPSGSGKSTLLNILGALDRPTVGKIYLKNIDIFSLNDYEIALLRNNLIGFIFQSYNLINRTTVLKNVEIPGILAGTKKNERIARALKLLDILGIQEKAKSTPSNLSGGQQQRVAIARAIMNNPAVILADEPTGNLDTKTGQDVFNLLKMLSNKFKRTVIMVTHNPDLSKETDRVIHLKDGIIEKEAIN
jgi:putative ABC transport system ATP-binding protein